MLFVPGKPFKYSVVVLCKAPTLPLKYLARKVLPPFYLGILDFSEERLTISASWNKKKVL
jgi:hypothetical protein